MPEDYKYDLFISYRRTNTPEEKEYGLRWVNKFRLRLGYWLNQELGYQPKIFFDEDSIETGNNWRDELKNGLKTAKLMIPIWNPPYFGSKWCLAEWKSFEIRQQKIDTHKVLFPVKVFDGENFPDEAKSRQWEDYVDYYSNEVYFWNGPKAEQLENRIKNFCSLIANAIKNPPPYEDFELANLPDDPVGHPSVPLQNFE